MQALTLFPWTQPKGPSWVWFLVRLFAPDYRPQERLFDPELSHRPKHGRSQILIMKPLVWHEASPLAEQLVDELASSMSGPTFQTHRPSFIPTHCHQVGTQAS